MDYPFDRTTDLTAIDRSTIIGEITLGVFKGESRRLKQAFEVIQNAQCNLLGTLDKGFLYQGNFYVDPSDPRRTSPRLGRKVIHPDLNDTFKEYLRDKSEVLGDKAEIKQILSLVLDPCKTMGDARDALPECCIAFTSLSFSRERPEGFTLENPRHIRQYNEVVEKLLYYAATNIIF